MDSVLLRGRFVIGPSPGLANVVEHLFKKLPAGQKPGPIRWFSPYRTSRGRYWCPNRSDFP